MAICEKHKHKIWHDQGEHCPVCHEIEKLKSELQAITLAFKVQDKIMSYQTAAYILVCAELADERFDGLERQKKAAQYYAEHFMSIAKKES